MGLTRRYNGHCPHSKVVYALVLHTNDVSSILTAGTICQGLDGKQVMEPAHGLLV